MREVARLAEVSVATVSMVLNNNNRISPATRTKVRRVMDQVGYRPNRNAQSLSSKYTKQLGVLLPPLRHAYSDPYFGELISGIADQAGKLGYKMLLEQADPDFLKDAKHLELFERKFIDGLLCLGVTDEHGFLHDLVEKNFPVLVVNNHFDDLKIDHIVCEYGDGAEQVMQFFTQLGHRKIGLIHGSLTIRTMRTVRDVFVRGLAAGGDPEDWMTFGNLDEEGGAEAVVKLMDRHPDMTAVFATNDKMALGAMHAIHQRGLSVPGDISVVGFDDLQTVAFVNPALTTVKLPLYDLGSEACDRLVQKIRGKSEGPIEVTVPTRLVLRNSTAIVRAESREA